jgi:hypothetical protein
MTLGIRKLIVVSLVAILILLPNYLLVAKWLLEKGVIDLAQHVRHEFLTGTAITIIVVLLILLVRPDHGLVSVWAATRRCPVCDHAVGDTANYCADCGSKVRKAGR